MSFYQNGILISGVNTLPELTRAQYEALPADKRPEYWVCLDEEYEPSSSGHTIQDNSGTGMPQEENLQFVGLKVTDDSTNGKTIVDATDNVTWKANGFLGAKNIMPYPYTRMSTVVRGITWGDNGDGGIVANGTGTEASSQPYCELYGAEANNTKSLLLKANTWYSLTCKRTSPYAIGANIYFLNPTTMLKTTYTYDVIWGDTSQTQVTAHNVYMFYNNVVYDEVKFRLPEDVYAQMEVRYRKGTDVTVVNDVQYPMLRLAEDTDRTYQLYAMTNRELTVGKADKADIATKESSTTASRAYSTGELLYYNGTLHRAKVPIASGATFTEGTNVEPANVSGSIDDKISSTKASNQTISSSLIMSKANSATSAITTDLVIGNNIPDGTTGSTAGRLQLYGTGSNRTILRAFNSTADRIIDFPNKSGTVALTSDFGWGNPVVVNLNSGTATYQKHTLFGLKRVVINSSSQPSTGTVLEGKIPSDYIPIISTLGTFYDNNGNSRHVLFYDTGNSGKMMINVGSTTGLVGEYLYW